MTDEQEQKLLRKLHEKAVREPKLGRWHPLPVLGACILLTMLSPLTHSYTLIGICLAMTLLAPPAAWIIGSFRKRAQTRMLDIAEWGVEAQTFGGKVVSMEWGEVSRASAGRNTAVISGPKKRITIRRKMFTHFVLICDTIEEACAKNAIRFTRYV